MRTIAAVVIAAIIVNVILWQLHSPDSPIEETDRCATGFAPDESFEADLLGAITRANSILPDGQKLFLLTEDNSKQAPPTTTPVYSARASVTGDMVVHVPVNCAEIVFNKEAFYSGLQTTLGDDVSVDNTRSLLAILLLHEVGHIANGHQGQFIPTTIQGDTNLGYTASKKLENEADQYVVSTIKPRITGEIPDDSFTAHNLFAFLGYLSFVIAGNNSINCFGCRPLGSKDIFWDHSRTHENLELRLLRISHGIFPNADSQQLLDNFEARRSANTNPRILYTDPDLAIDTEAPDGYNLGLDLDLDLTLEEPDWLKEKP